MPFVSVRLPSKSVYSNSMAYRYESTSGSQPFLVSSSQSLAAAKHLSLTPSLTSPSLLFDTITITIALS
jgi:hypothetical protein